LDYQVDRSKSRHNSAINWLLRNLADGKCDRMEEYDFSPVAQHTQFLYGISLSICYPDK
jgi:hypothetical protein